MVITQVLKVYDDFKEPHLSWIGESGYVEEKDAQALSEDDPRVKARAARPEWYRLEVPLNSAKGDKL